MKELYDRLCGMSGAFWRSRRRLTASWIDDLVPDWEQSLDWARKQVKNSEPPDVPPLTDAEIARDTQMLDEVDEMEEAERAAALAAQPPLAVENEDTDASETQMTEAVDISIPSHVRDLRADVPFADDDDPEFPNQLPHELEALDSVPNTPDPLEGVPCTTEDDDGREWDVPDAGSEPVVEDQPADVNLNPCPPEGFDVPDEEELAGREASFAEQVASEINAPDIEDDAASLTAAPAVEQSYLATRQTEEALETGSAAQEFMEEPPTPLAVDSTPQDVENDDADTSPISAPENAESSVPPVTELVTAPPQTLGERVLDVLRRADMSGWQEVKTIAEAIGEEDVNEVAYALHQHLAWGRVAGFRLRTGRAGWYFQLA